MLTICQRGSFTFWGWLFRGGAVTMVTRRCCDTFKVHEVDRQCVCVSAAVNPRRICVQPRRVCRRRECTQTTGQHRGTHHRRAGRVCVCGIKWRRHTGGSVDARDEFPRISEHSSQLGKLHTAGGGGKRRTGGVYAGRGRYPCVCVCGSLVCMSCMRGAPG